MQHTKNGAMWWKNMSSLHVESEIFLPCGVRSNIYIHILYTNTHAEIIFDWKRTQLRSILLCMDFPSPVHQRATFRECLLFFKCISYCFWLVIKHKTWLFSSQSFSTASLFLALPCCFDSLFIYLFLYYWYFVWTSSYSIYSSIKCWGILVPANTYVIAATNSCSFTTHQCKPVLVSELLKPVQV